STKRGASLSSSAPTTPWSWPIPGAWCACGTASSSRTKGEVLVPLLVRLAFRNLWRNRRRTVATFGALSVGIALLIFMESLSSGFGAVGFRNLVDFETGHVQVHAPGYFDDRENLPLKPSLAAAPVLEAVRAAQGVEAATPRVQSAARLHKIGRASCRERVWVPMGMAPGRRNDEETDRVG